MSDNIKPGIDGKPFELVFDENWFKKDNPFDLETRTYSITATKDFLDTFEKLFEIKENDRI